MSPIEFCIHWCGDLTYPQQVITNKAIEEGRFIGVGRAIGGMSFYPLVSIDERGTKLNVIDKVGYYQLSSVEGRRAYNF